jgi:hypothetical protein
VCGLYFTELNYYGYHDQSANFCVVKALAAYILTGLFSEVTHSVLNLPIVSQLGYWLSGIWWKRKAQGP